MSQRPRCVVVLSTKSAGSSALQELLLRHAGAACVSHTRHAQHETLYWTKAASFLGLPQIRIPDSEVPFSRRRAEVELRTLLRENVPNFAQPQEAMELAMSGWRALCQQYGPLFVEKSPHHLHQWSVLELLLEAENNLPDIDFRYVGLVRNPMDALYSMWNRRRDDLAKYQEHWRIAYANLERFQQQAGERIAVVRYEDLSPPGNAVQAIFDLLGIEAGDAARGFIHGKSQQRWRRDRWFGLVLDRDLYRLARKFGYSDEELQNDTFMLWPALRTLGRFDPRFWDARWRNMRRNLRNLS